MSSVEVTVASSNKNESVDVADRPISKSIPVPELILMLSPALEPSSSVPSSTIASTPNSESKFSS